MQQTKKGFTLIELLVVIAIIGILSAIGLVSLNGARERARDAKRKSDLSQISTGLALYYDDNSSVYPGENPAALWNAGLSSALVPTVLQTFPTPEQAAGANSYWYVTNSAAMTVNTVSYAVNKLYALATKLEGGTQKVYVSNAVGQNVEVGATGTVLSAATLECADTVSTTGDIDACDSTVTVI